MEISKKEETEEQKEDKQKLLKESEVSLILDTYDDLFSSFDPRPYNQRAISTDFLEEASRATRNLPKGGIQLKFLMPYKLRNLPTENVIRKRLKEHFAHHHLLEEEYMKKIKWQGAKWFAVGTAFILFSTFIYDKEGFIFTLLKTITEPAGWFSFWEGLGKIFIVTEEKSPKLKFYKRMSKADVSFMSY